MTIICINDIHESSEFFAGETLSRAAQSATEARVGEVTATEVVPVGGTHYHVRSRDADPEGFWLAQLAHSLSDGEDFGWGETEAEARSHASG